MSHQCIAIACVVASLLATADVFAAGGGHGGGAHAGGGHVGSPGFHGGWHGGGGHGAYPYGCRGCGYGYGWGYPGWYAAGLGVGIGLGYASWYNYPYPYPYPYPAPYLVYGEVAAAPPPYPPPAGTVAGASPAPGVNPPPGAPSPVRLTDADVLIHVRVPPDAAVWLNEHPTHQTGPQREFASSGLIPGRQYTYSIRARWTAPGGEIVDQERRVSVQGGERRTVDFAAPDNGPPFPGDGPAH